MKRVRWTARAQADLDNADRHYRPIDPGYAYWLGQEALAASRFLGEYPEAGPVFGGGTRKWRVRSTDYLLVYRIVGNQVQILRLRHARENWRVHP